MFFLYASFPNSRARPRDPTTEAVTYQTSIGSENDATPTPVRVGTANPNRTYLLLQNLDLQYNTFYLYATLTTVNPTAVATFGVLNQLLRDAGGVFYVKTVDDGTNTNWAVVPNTDYTLIGEEVGPRQSADLESLEDVYAISDAPAATPVILGMDEGRN